MRHFLPLVAVPLLVTGCGGGGGASTIPGSAAIQTVRLQQFNEPWGSAAPRWMDIDDVAYNSAFRTSFSYANSEVIIQYETDPANGYFVGRIRGRGLKPNFAYQMKLAGKPVSGTRGWGQYGDDVTNEAIGRAARWWNDAVQANSGDSSFATYYDNAPPAQRQTIYGYQFMGDVITDAQGNVDASFDGSKALHVTWQDKQNQHRDVNAGIFTIGSLTPPYYGYGRSVPQKSIRLWYEWESGRTRAVRLPAGNYNCRFLITEEAFHAGTALGGLWQTVLANEDFLGGQPDSNAENDIRFTIK